MEKRDKEKSSDFKARFAASDTAQTFQQEQAICTSIWHGVTVERADDNSDKYGHFDLAVHCRDNGRGKPAVIKIDVKRREAGAAKFWKNKNDPELCLEIWSVKPYVGEPRGKAGWTLREDAQADYILFVFDKQDTDKYYILPFQLLRSITRANYEKWRAKYGERENRKTDEAWASSAIYVPASVLLGEVTKKMFGIAV